MPTGMSIRSKTRTLTQDRMTTTKTNTTQRTKRLPRLARRPFVATRSTGATCHAHAKDCRTRAAPWDGLVEADAG